MANPASTTHEHDESTLEVDLKDPRVAAFLAWLLPGLGHIYQGRNGKGILYFVCIVGTFVFGLYIGEGRVVYASTNNIFSLQFLDPSVGGRWQYICQLGAGLPALPALVQRYRSLDGKPPLINDYFMRPPQMIGGVFTSGMAPNQVRHPHELAKWYYDLGDMFEMGTVFTVIAGLLNVLAIYDAHGGPLVIVPRGEKKEPSANT
jgi:TM2 domain-containing membrane protein YozV